MLHESVVVVRPGENVVRAYLSGDGEIPVITISETRYSTNSLKIQLASSCADNAAWLRDLAGQLEDLAEQVEPSGTILAEHHIAEAKAAAGIGGAS